MPLKPKSYKVTVDASGKFLVRVTEPDGRIRTDSRYDIRSDAEARLRLLRDTPPQVK